jgi:hypothetical protein
VRGMRSAYATCVLVANRWRRMLISRSFPERHYFFTDQPIAFDMFQSHSAYAKIF